MIDRLVLATIRSSLPDEKARVSFDLLFRSHFSGDEDLVVRRAFDAIVADDGDTDKSHSQESMDLVYAFLHGKENDAIEPEVLDESMMASFFAIVTSDFRDTSLVRTRLKWDEHVAQLVTDFSSLSSHHAFKGCVAALDGWLCGIKVPPSAKPIQTHL